MARRQPVLGSSMSSREVLSGNEAFREKVEKQGLAQQLSDVSHLQAPHQIESMHFNGSDADLQVVSHFSVCQTLSDQTQDFLLAGRQSCVRFSWASGLPLASSLLSRP